MTPHLLGNEAGWQQWCIATFSLYECQQWWVEGKWILELLVLWWYERMNNRILRRRRALALAREAAHRERRHRRRHAKRHTPRRMQ